MTAHVTLSCKEEAASRAARQQYDARSCNRRQAADCKGESERRDELELHASKMCVTPTQRVSNRWSSPSVATDSQAPAPTRRF
mmetsp:Transcript_37519/g.78942  ORF Transcript_37519/g.78942 Transcript_37519/m.78942 type:complete len:83 (-) Transcript_37519:11-259(-)